MTPTLTATPTPTITLTPTATYTPTPQFFIEVTTPAGEAARIERAATGGDIVIILLLFALLASLWAMYLFDRFGKRGDA
jgi:hypothetical protein